MFPFLAIDTKLGSDNCWCSESRNQSKSCENLQGSLYKNRTKFYMSGNDWIQINEFCKKVGWNFLFDFNVLKRNRKGNWRYVPKINFPFFSFASFLKHTVLKIEILSKISILTKNGQTSNLNFPAKIQMKYFISFFKNLNFWTKNGVL